VLLTLESKSTIHVSAAKILVPQVVRDVVDRGIQVFGGGGVPQDYTLSYLYSTVRFLQIADGPDEVHRRSIAHAKLKAKPIFEVM
jgi:acyl-CoA dehydrogenase